MATKFLLTLLLFHLSTTAYSIGVNYGTLGDNLPPPSQVANFLKTQTIIDSLKIFDMNPDIIRAFANSGISLTITLPNGDIPTLTNPRAARRWIQQNIKPFYPATLIRYICVGTEVLHWGDDAQKSNLVAAMRTLNNALRVEGFKGIKVSTPHSLGIMLTSEPPSQGRFRPEVTPILIQMLRFLRESNSPLMVNPYPYFGWSPENENYALFRQSRIDPITKLTYTSMFDGLLDAVYSAAKALGFPDVNILVGETGWPSACEFPVCSMQHAADYNGNLVKHVESGKGTPLMPNRKFETYIFSMFNENQKPGPLAEKNWGLFYPNLAPVYNVGIMRNQQGGGGSIPNPTPAKPAPTTPPGNGGKVWCIAKPGATNQALQANLDYACSQPGGVDCGPIQPGGACFDEDVRARASYAMNSYYQVKGGNDFNCDFSGTGLITITDPSHGGCKYIEAGGQGPSGPTPTQPSKPAQPSKGGWCVPKPGVTDAVLQQNMDWLCGTHKVHCNNVMPGAKCYAESILPRASYLMDVYYKKYGRHDYDCDFNGSAQITNINPTASDSLLVFFRNVDRAVCIVLSANIDYACNQASVNCQDVRPGGACFNSDLKTRASFAMNAFYNLYRSLGGTCDFSGSGQIINTDPSTFSCKFVASDGDSGSKLPPRNVYNPKPIPKTPKRSVLGGDGPVRKWCVAKPHSDTDTLDKHLDWLCGMVECQAIKPGGACYDESIRAQASFAMNSYYQTKGRNDNNCDFSGTAVITTVDPSHGPCHYLS
ncbi:PREDICTED: glucan endo-1,3-beta-glucosidase-like [Fragaria vesca subsp. vesca]